MLRSYDSRREPAPEFDCRIWEAGRATCAIGLAFKPIQIGQSVFHDDGPGDFNPSIFTLDEAVVNEWPGREVGVFVSVGTGKRPKGSDENSTVWYEGFLGEYAEARRKLISKIEGCERIHEYMKREHLARRGVNIENYYRLNVEVGVGEFGMNEWHRLADISTNTRRYLARDDEQKMVQGISAKLAKIHFAKQRLDRLSANIPDLVKTSSDISIPFAAELPGDFPTSPTYRSSPSRQSYESGAENLSLPTGNTPPQPRNSGERLFPPSPTNSNHSFPPRAGGQQTAPPARTTAHNLVEDADRLVVTAPTPAQYRNASGADKIAVLGPEDQARRHTDANSTRLANPVQPHRIEPPPLPPKTPLPEHAISGNRRSGGAPPYPLDDEPPPAVNMARKPEYRGR
jgi:hypothetical protein